jgi:hypothetical protein
MTRDEILMELNTYIDVLTKPMPTHEVLNGWDAEHQQRALTMFSEIRESLRSGKPIPKWSIVRTLDSWGVNGKLFDQACAISHRLSTIED